MSKVVHFIPVDGFDSWFDILPGQKVEIFIDGKSRGTFFPREELRRLYVFTSQSYVYEDDEDLPF